jgi:hypothetical protein
MIYIGDKKNMYAHDSVAKSKTIVVFGSNVLSFFWGGGQYVISNVSII